ncbi:hypothetical protein RRG08_045732 [Elysia crispata]|uniref:Uncharacterized protein n=1 Tax=Elysia crispata TaxID=231223 RepID=A0AAE1B117_9GAST|nr:hypothetical protein RRG08_045732 [Elysia crispata]
MGSKPGLNSMYNDLWANHLKATDAKDLKISDSPRYATFTYPGMPFWSFELDPRVPGFINILRVCEDCLYFGSQQQMPGKKNQTLMQIRELVAENYIPFHGAHEYKINPEIYDEDVPKWPLKVKFSYVGRYGPLVHVQIQVFTAETNKLLVTRTQTFSFVNTRTRKIDDLPEWYTRELDGKEVTNHTLQVDRMVKPEKTYKYNTTVLFSDTDTFQHANYLTYIRFCQKALRQAVTECMRGATTSGQKQTTGKLDQSSAWPRKVTADVMRKGVKSAKCRYFNECVGGDEVTVHLWEESDKPLWVFFSVETNTPASNILRFQMSIEYFKP